MSDESVHGVVIGGEHHYYEFWTTKKETWNSIGPHKLGGGWFDNDADAEAHARKTYPAEYKAGLEMRAFE